MPLSPVCFQSALPPSHHIISSHLPDSVLSAPSPLTQSLALSFFHPPEQAVELCFPLLEVPIARLAAPLSNPITEEGCLLCPGGG